MRRDFVIRFLFLSILGLIIIFEFISCKDTQTEVTKEIVFPDSNVSFSKHVEPLFQQRCAQASCHGGNNPQADLNLEYNSYSSIRNKPGLVIGGDANGSRLTQRLEGKLPQMPPPKFPQLTTNQIQGVKKWINEGASNN